MVRGVRTGADRVGGDVAGRRVDVAEDGSRPGGDDRLRRRVERERRHHDLVVGTNAERLQRDRDRIGAVRDTDYVADTEVGGEVLLELPDLGPEDVHAALDHLRDAFEDLLAEREQGGLGVEQADGHLTEANPSEW